MPLTARRYLRKMRGGAQSHLIEADDGKFYIVKFRNNPQHRRILVNELIAAEFLSYLQISAPRAAMIDVSADFLLANPEMYLSLGSRRVPIEPGWHFGSLHPGNPDTLAVYDFLPDALLVHVANLSEFLGVLAFDKWMGNADGRQSVFFRAQLREWSPGKPKPVRAEFVAWMIDHGFVFDGPNWTFQDAPLQGLYPRRLVYEHARRLDDFQPWLDLILNFPEEVMDRALRSIPPAWLDGEEAALENLLEELMRRRQRVPELLSTLAAARNSPFPEWRGR